MIFNILNQMKPLTVQVVLLALVLNLAACSASQKDRAIPLRIAVAANVQFAMEEIEQLFEKESGIGVESIAGSSGKLTAQIMEGAPFDLFLSADMKYADSLFSKKMAVHAPLVYAYGSLVAWTFQDNIVLNQLKELLLDESLVKKIAIANPKNAPYGVQTIHFFNSLNILEAVSAKLIYGESIAQTNQYINSGAVDIGFTAKSIVLSPEMAGKGTWVSVDPELYQPIAQGVVITTHGKQEQAEAAKRFLEFIFSKPAQEVFKKYGYEVPDSQPVLPY